MVYMCRDAGLPGHYTMKMYQQDLDEQFIMEIMKHRSLTAQLHKCTSERQKNWPTGVSF